MPCSLRASWETMLFLGEALDLFPLVGGLRVYKPNGPAVFPPAPPELALRHKPSVFSGENQLYSVFGQRLRQRSQQRDIPDAVCAFGEIIHVGPVAVGIVELFLDADHTPLPVDIGIREGQCLSPPEAEKRYGEIAAFLGLEPTSKALIAHLLGMNAKLDIPACIKDYEGGIIDEREFLDKLPKVAELALGDACTGSNPRSITPAEMEKLLRCCFYDEEVDF